MDTYIKNFIKFLEESKRSSATIIAYKNDLTQCLEYINKVNGKTALQQANAEDLKQFLDYLHKEKGFNLKTISRKINSLRTFFGYLQSLGIVKEETNPALKLKHPKIESKPPRILSPIEYHALRDASRSKVRLYTMVEVLLQTGIRIAELQRLRVDDVRETQNGRKYLYIRQFGSQASRSVPLNKTAYDAIMTYLKERPNPIDENTKNIFLTQTGRSVPVRKIRSAIKRAFKKAGIKDATINDIRNTFIAHHLANGVNVLTVARIVGHKRISTTEKYVGLVRTKTNQDKLKEL